MLHPLLPVNAPTCPVPELEMKEGEGSEELWPRTARLPFFTLPVLRCQSKEQEEVHWVGEQRWWPLLNLLPEATFLVGLIDWLTLLICPGWRGRANESWQLGGSWPSPSVWARYSLEEEKNKKQPFGRVRERCELSDDTSLQGSDVGQRIDCLVGLTALRPYLPSAWMFAKKIF